MPRKMKTIPITKDAPFRGGCRAEFDEVDNGIITACRFAMNYLIEHSEFVDDVDSLKISMVFGKEYLRRTDRYDRLTFTLRNEDK